MAKPKASLGQHARLTRRAKHLITLLRKTKVHSVRQAILRELAHEFDRIRRGTRAAGRTARRGGHAARRTAHRSRLYARLEAWALDRAHHLGNRLRYGATFIGHAGEIRGGIHGQRAYAEKHAREADREPHERDGKRDERTPRQQAKDHARDHLAAAGRLDDDGQLTRDPLQGHVSVRDLRDQARADRSGGDGLTDAVRDLRDRDPEAFAEYMDASYRVAPQPAPDRVTDSRDRAEDWARDAGWGTPDPGRAGRVR